MILPYVRPSIQLQELNLDQTMYAKGAEGRHTSAEIGQNEVKVVQSVQIGHRKWLRSYGNTPTIYQSPGNVRVVIAAAVRLVGFVDKSAGYHMNHGFRAKENVVVFDICTRE